MTPAQTEEKMCAHSLINCQHVIYEICGIEMVVKGSFCHLCGQSSTATRYDVDSTTTVSEAA